MVIKAGQPEKSAIARMGNLYSLFHTTAECIEFLVKMDAAPAAALATLEQQQTDAFSAHGKVDVVSDDASDARIVYCVGFEHSTGILKVDPVQLVDTTPGAAAPVTSAVDFAADGLIAVFAEAHATAGITVSEEGGVVSTFFTIAATTTEAFYLSFTLPTGKEAWVAALDISLAGEDPIAGDDWGSLMPILDTINGREVGANTVNNDVQSADLIGPAESTLEIQQAGGAVVPSYHIIILVV